MHNLVDLRRVIRQDVSNMRLLPTIGFDTAAENEPSRFMSLSFDIQHISKLKCDIFRFILHSLETNGLS